MTEYTFIGRDELALEFYLNYLVTIYFQVLLLFIGNILVLVIFIQKADESCYLNYVRLWKQDEGSVIWLAEV